MASTQLYLVRHGEQDPASGHAADGGLSHLGREQAGRLGRRLRRVPFSAIHHSPLARAAQTADVIADHLPQVPRHACDFTADRTPVPSAGQRDRYPDLWLAWLDGVPGDERDEDATARETGTVSKIMWVSNPMIVTEDRACPVIIPDQSCPGATRRRSGESAAARWVSWPAGIRVGGSGPA